jgi:hypothetical protein
VRREWRYSSTQSCARKRLDASCLFRGVLLPQVRELERGYKLSRSTRHESSMISSPLPYVLRPWLSSVMSAQMGALVSSWRFQQQERRTGMEPFWPSLLCRLCSRHPFAVIKNSQKKLVMGCLTLFAKFVLAPRVGWFSPLEYTVFKKELYNFKS